MTFARLWSSCTNRIVMHLRQLSLFSV